MNRLIAFFVNRELFANLLTVILITFGAFSLYKTQREMFPNVSFDIISIDFVFPGASPDEVEKLIINPLEQDLNEVDGIKRLQSYAIEGSGRIVAVLDPDQTTEAEAKADIQDIVDQFTDLPEDAKTPIVTSIESKQTPVIEITVGGSARDIELRQIAKDIEKEIEKISSVAKVVPSALREKEIHVQAKPEMLARYRISLDEIVSALKLQNLNVPGGVIESDPENNSKEILVRTLGELKSPDDIRKTIIRANDFGKSIQIQDVADVEYSLERPTLLTRTNGLPSINLTVLKKEKADAINLVRDLKLKVDELKSRYGTTVELNLVNDSSVYIVRRLSVLSGNLIVGLFLVLFILALVLPFRVAVLVSLGIPFAFLGTMIIFYTYGLSINLISMIGLIIVTGMLVDDAIIVVDNAYRFMAEGYSPKDAAILGTQQIWPAITASVGTTICVFIPMLLMSGIFGKFVRQIPLGVIIPLIISLLEAFFILPAHIASWIKPPSQVKEPKAKKPNIITRLLEHTTHVWESKILPRYIISLEKVLKRRYLSLGSVAVVFVLVIIFAVKKMDFVLFPPDGIEQFYIRVEAPVGTSLETTAELMKPIEAKISEIPKIELDNYVTLVGLQMQDPNDPNRKMGSHLGQITVFLTPEANRERLANEILEATRKNIVDVKGFEYISFDKVNPGPPVGKAIDIGVRGENYEQILPAVAKLKKIISEIEGSSDVRDSYLAGKEEVHVIINSNEAAAAGLNVAAIGTTVRAAFEGIIASSIQELDDEIDIRVTLPSKSKTNIETLKKLEIPNRLGNLIPLKNIANFKMSSGISIYSHEDNQRQVKVNADLNTQITNTSKVTPILMQKTKELEKEFKGVSFDFGGESEDTQESLQSLMEAFALSIALIVLILVFLFQNLLQPLLVILVIPLGIIAALGAFFFHGVPISFMGMLGIIALGGVIVNNAIVMIDFVNFGRTKNLGLTESILDAAKIRARPILLTSLTTVCGLMPTAYGIGGMDRFVRPIALALGWGLLIGSFLTAYVIPASIAVTDDIRNFIIRFKKEKLGIT